MVNLISLILWCDIPPLPALGAGGVLRAGVRGRLRHTSAALCLTAPITT